MGENGGSLDLLRNAVLEYAGDKETANAYHPQLLTLSSLRELQSSVSRLAADLEVLNRQHAFHMAAVNTKNLVSQLSTGESIQNGASSTTTMESEIIPKQAQLLDKQKTLIRHYTSLLSDIAESYVFPLSNALETIDQLEPVGIPELQFDVDSLLITDDDDDGYNSEMPQYEITKLINTALTKSPAGVQSLQQTVPEEEHVAAVSALRSQIESHQSENQDLKQAVSELESTVLSISNQQGDQLSQLRREYELSQRQLKAAQRQLEQQAALHAEADRKQNEHTVDPVVLDRQQSGSKVLQLQTENASLRERIAQLESDMTAIGDEHASEFETILMQNASLNERLAEIEAKWKRGSVPSTPVTAVAANSNDTHQRLIQLQSELNLLRVNHDSLMDQYAEFENERAGLERTISALQDRNDRLEAKILDNRVKVLASHTNESNINDSESTSIGVLRREFRKLVAEIKSEHAAAMKAEFEERRRLEKVIRDMKHAAM